MTYGTEGQGGGSTTSWTGQMLDPNSQYTATTPFLSYFSAGPVPNTSVQSPCTQNNHWFACKHERFCECGKVERKDWDQQMDEGL